MLQQKEHLFAAQVETAGLEAAQRRDRQASLVGQIAAEKPCPFSESTGQFADVLGLAGCEQVSSE